jgi:type I restriction enzyme S subunit
LKRTQYQEYKDTGIDWIPRIPEHWELKKLKYVVDYNKHSLRDDTDPDYTFDYIDISSVDLVKGIVKKETMNFETAPSRARRIVHCGDTIISTVRTYLKAIATINEEVTDLIVSTGFVVLTPREKVTNQYLSFYVQSQQFVDSVVANSTGVSYPAINPTALIELPIVFPNPIEQESIAIFLSSKISALDNLITQKEQLLILLEEKRIALITQAVTKGLNPDVKMKPSGIDWLGDIPEHWELKKLKYLCDGVRTGTTPPSAGADYFSDGEINWYTPGDFDSNEVILDEAKKKLRVDAINEGIVKTYPPNTVLIIGIGATLGKVGVSKTESSSNQQINAILTNDLIDPIFLVYILSVQQEILKVFSNATTLGILNQEKTKRFVVPFTHILEQRTICNYIQEKSELINKLEIEVELAIEKLKEYRISLITSAVTGQIDVRDFVQEQENEKIL